MAAVFTDNTCLNVFWTFVFTCSHLFIWSLSINSFDIFVVHKITTKSKVRCLRCVLEIAIMTMILTNTGLYSNWLWGLATAVYKYINVLSHEQSLPTLLVNYHHRREEKLDLAYLQPNRVSLEKQY